MNLNYPIELIPDKKAGGYTVTFPDVPEAITEGDDLDEALLRAADALETALEFYTAAGKALPKASKPKRGQHTVRPCAQACIKLGIYEAMRVQGVRKSELARRLGWHMPQVDRLLDLHHASRLEHAETALHALGRRLDVAVA
ncbi:type II toxin-antitoxin system HicB family antitoxin [Thermomonas sp.]|uniref:type II toxin-antitoxin system HicB family antitoxin n=1 Tax=Thermomonas sp. TaxID=1971895 RepID=UPI0035AD9C52